MLTPAPSSPRLSFRLLARTDLQPFHRLARDEHVRRFLLDGELVSEAWCEQLIAASAREFAENKLGIWLLHAREGVEVGALGFAGFWRFDGIGATPQLVYALKEEHTGRGYAREVAVALIHFARAHKSLSDIDAAVDEPNLASCRVLTGLGFMLRGEVPGAFGKMLLFRLSGGTPPKER